MSTWMSRSSRPGARDGASAMLCVLPGTYVTLNWYPATFSRSLCSLGFVSSEMPLVNVPTKGLWSVAIVKSGRPLR